MPTYSFLNEAWSDPVMVQDNSGKFIRNSQQGMDELDNQFKDKDKSNNRIKVNEEQFLEEFLSKIVCSDTTVEVVDKKGDIKGYITNKELETSLVKS